MALLEPGKNFEIDFRPVLTGKRTYGNVIFENVGVTSCSVILEIFDYNEDVFSLTVDEDALALLSGWEFSGKSNNFQISNVPKSCQIWHKILSASVVPSPCPKFTLANNWADRSTDRTTDFTYGRVKCLSRDTYEKRTGLFSFRHWGRN